MKKRSVRIAGHPTSITLEDEFWQALNDIAGAQGKPVHALIAEIDDTRTGNKLSSAVRIYVLEAVRRK